MKCLLLEISKKRKFFTQERNFNQLIEFCKKFKANVFLVKLSKGKPAELEELIPAVCDSYYKTPDFEYSIIAPKITFKKIKNADKKNTIESYISKQLLFRKTVSIKKLQAKFKKFNLSYASFNNYLKKTVASLEQQGYTIRKNKEGNYYIQ